MPVSPNFTSIYSTDFTIDFSQCYPNGYLKYTDLCNLIQLCAAEHAEVGGISFTDMQEAHQAWVISRMRLEISSLPKWRETVTVKTWIESLHNSRSVRAIEVFCNGEKIVGCETFWAVFNTQTRRPEALALPHDHFTIYNENFSTVQRVSKVKLVEVENVVSQRIVLLSDLDIVNHVNNVKYLEWCLDILDPELIMKRNISSIDMNFLKELAFADTVEIATLENAFTVYKDTKPCFALSFGMFE